MPNSNRYEDALVQFIKDGNGKYPAVYGLGNLYRLFFNYNGRFPENPILPADTYIRNPDGSIYLDGGNPVVSPIATDSTMDMVGKLLGTTARNIEDVIGQKFTMVQNGGEYGLWVLGERWPLEYWGRDPLVREAMAKAGFNPSNDGFDWLPFNSIQKARQERRIKEAMYAQLAKGRPVAYTWYQESFGPERGRWNGWPKYGWDWKYFIENGKPVVSDYNSLESYYNFANAGWFGKHEGLNLPIGQLTLFLRSVGGIQSLGQRNSHPWVSQGWDGGDAGGISDDDMFIGAMKTFYTAGTIGAASGYFTCDGAPFQIMSKNLPVGTQTPTQIRGAANLAKVHALFTFLEPFLRDGDLLPGNRNHPFRNLDITTPAMEFDVEGEVVPIANWWDPADWQRDNVQRTARVLARKMRNADRWLVTAWANTGNDRDVVATIDPRLGPLTLRARKAGSVYIVDLVDSKPRLRLVDEDAMNPTRNLFASQGAL
ncbi:MAG: hypothetical protein CTY25_15330 [Methylobacterium sp.]|nr:MAG: hypothetical protein CTY25_15330 [Methylobacterium sp.]